MKTHKYIIQDGELKKTPIWRHIFHRPVSLKKINPTRAKTITRVSPNVMTDVHYIPYILYKSNVGYIRIPSNTQYIQARAFAYCPQLIFVDIAPGATSIDENAFYQCGSLHTIIIPHTVQTIKNHAFHWCRHLEHIEMGRGLESIGKCAFAHCNYLYKIVIPDGVKTIGCEAFTGCKNLSSVIIPDSVQELGLYLFNGCDNLTYISMPRRLATCDVFCLTCVKGLSDKSLVYALSKLLPARPDEHDLPKPVIGPSSDVTDIVARQNHQFTKIPKMETSVRPDTIKNEFWNFKILLNLKNFADYHAQRS